MNASDWLISNLKTAEERISDPKHYSVGIILNKETKGKKTKRNTQSIQNL